MGSKFSSHAGYLRAGACGVCLALLVALTSSSSANADNWTASGLLGKSKKLDASNPKSSKDVSGIACAATTGFPRVCLVIDDEARSAQVVVLDNQKMIGGSRIHLSDKQFDGEPVELDGEGVAFADGAFIVTGSHGRPRKTDDGSPEAEAKAQASRQIFRVKLPDIDLETAQLKGDAVVSPPSIKLSEILQTNVATKAAFNKKLAEGGLSVEGIAVSGGLLYVGLRQPVGPQGATILSLPVASVFDGATGAQNNLSVDLGKTSYGAARGVRDLSAYGDDLLILAGPERNPPDGQIVKTGDYAIYRFVLKTGTRSLPKDIDGTNSEAKPEALLPLTEKDGRLSVLVLSDGVSQGAPREISIEFPR